LSNEQLGGTKAFEVCGGGLMLKAIVVADYFGTTTIHQM